MNNFIKNVIRTYNKNCIVLSIVRINDLITFPFEEWTDLSGKRD